MHGLPLRATKCWSATTKASEHRDSTNAKCISGKTAQVNNVIPVFSPVFKNKRSAKSIPTTSKPHNILLGLVAKGLNIFYLKLSTYYAIVQKIHNGFSSSN